ncbi:MAG: adenosine kinase [Pseudomonadota bacterium]
MAEIQVAALGNAIVDVLAEVNEGFLEEHGIPKGGMTLIDTEKAEAITAAFSDTVLVAGGSAGNSMACMASFGGTARFIGSIADDELGAAYRKSMEDIGVTFDTPAKTGGLPTGRCLISVTPDAERSMATYLGAASDIRIEDLQPGDVENAQVFFIEGYHFESEASRHTCEEAAKRAKMAGRFAAITLADSGMVQRQLEPLKPFLKERTDMVFANALEAEALTGESDPKAAAEAMRGYCLWGAVTMSEKGSYVFGPQGDVEYVEAYKPAQLVDTTGAGDAYAAGWIYGFTTCHPLKECGMLGALAATEVISHMGARPEKSLQKIAQQKGLLATA